MRAEIIASEQWESPKKFEELQKTFAQAFSSVGAELFCINTAAGSEEKLKALLKLALSRSDVVVVCSRMGVGENNEVVKNVSAALGLQTVCNEVLCADITSFFAAKGKKPQESDLAMAQLPAGAVVFRSKGEVCPGCAVRSSNQCVLMLPLDMDMLKPMLCECVVPYLSALGSASAYTETVKIFYCGASCSEIGAQLQKLGLDDVTCELSEKYGEISVHIRAKGGDVRDGENVVRKSADRIRSYFGLDALGREYSCIEEDVVEMLKQKGLTLATAESCTAGLISKRITDIPGASRVFELGAATYATQKKHELLGVPQELIDEYGVVSAEVAAAMAVGAIKLSRSKLAVSVTGYAGPEGGDGKPVGLVYIALCDGEQVWMRRLQLGANGADRDGIRHEAASHALDLVRSYLHKLPGRLEGGEPCRVKADESVAVVPVMTAQPQIAAKKRKRRSFSDIIYRVLFVAALLTMLGSGGYLVYNLVILPYATEKTVQGVAALIDGQISVSSGDIFDDSWKYTQDGMLIKYAAVKAQNEDFVAWIRIPNTKIDYPVMQSSEGSPEYYLRRDFYGEYNSNGSVFAYYSCSLEQDSLSRNTIIFGHNMRSGMMFHDLMYYDIYQKSGSYKSPDYETNLDFYKENAVFDFDTVYDESEWVVFSVMKLNTLSSHGELFDFIRADFADDEDFVEFISEIRKRSIIDTYDCIDVDEDDYLLTMQTCSYEYSDFRTVVVARRLRPGESIDVSSATIAQDPLMPDIWNK